MIEIVEKCVILDIIYYVFPIKRYMVNLFYKVGHAFKILAPIIYCVSSIVITKSPVLPHENNNWSAYFI